MTLVQIIVLAVVQGLTEYLPVSSSAHLILVSRLFAWPDQGLAMDVAVHLGTLVAVLVYFRRDLLAMLICWMHHDGAEATRQNRRLSVYLAFASIPVLFFGWLLHDWVATALRDVRVIAVSTVLFGLVLWLADWLSRRDRGLDQLGWGSVAAIGLAQVLALVPGVSRSGVTITMGRFLGFGADAAARFSFLLSIPVIAAAGAHGAWQLRDAATTLSWQAFVLAVGFAAVAGWTCIAAFLALLRRVGLLPFILYRLALGLLLAWLVF